MRLSRSLAAGFVPEIAQASEAQWTAAEAAIAEALAARPARVRRQLALLILLLDWIARVRYGKPIAAIELEQRAALLEALSRAPVLLLRRGIWGLRTLVMLGWYTLAEVAASLGYRASAAGWDAVR